ncbi:hypothetical protein UPYG_G00319420 [Umbra pygmaea]|uniref:LIM zinc-binding domain-containing protein n=1 Tax=Umbra pygmaea TaxID=75934 RepID=A0ABD0W4X1_UMBPY
MAYNSYSKTSYSSNPAKSSSPSQVNEDSKKKTSLLKDNSWIKRNAEEDEAIDQDPNFGRVVLNKYRSNEALDSTEPAISDSLKTPTTNIISSVDALKKRFGGSQDELSKGRTTFSKTSVTDEPKKTSTTTTTTVKSQSFSKPSVVKSATINTGSFSDRVLTSKKGTDVHPFDVISTSVKTEYLIPDSTTSVSKTENVSVKMNEKDNPSGDGIKTSTTTRRTSSKAEDDLYDSLLPISINSRYSSLKSTTSVSKPESVSVKTLQNDITSGDEIKTSTITSKRSSSKVEDDLYDSFMDFPDTSPKSTTSITRNEVVSIKNPKVCYSGSDETPSTSSTYFNSSKPSEDTSNTTNKNYSSKLDNSYQYTSVTSPTDYSKSTNYKDSRILLEKDLCSYCRKPMNSDPKMVLEDMKINCHTTCFKCEVCSSDLGHLKAGDSMWVYKNTIHCEPCFEVTRGKWHR